MKEKDEMKQEMTSLDLSFLQNYIISNISLAEKKTGHLKYYDKFFWKKHNISYQLETNGDVTVYEYDYLGNDQWSINGRKIAHFRLPSWMI